MDYLFSDTYEFSVALTDKYSRLYVVLTATVSNLESVRPYHSVLVFDRKTQYDWDILDVDGGPGWHLICVSYNMHNLEVTGNRKAEI